MKRTAIWTAFPFLLLWTVLLSAKDSTGVIRGNVVDAIDGSAIDDTDVYLLGATIYGGRVVATEAGGSFTFTSPFD